MTAMVGLRKIMKEKGVLQNTKGEFFEIDAVCNNDVWKRKPES